MVLLPQFSLTTFQTLEYSVKRRGGTFVHHIEEVQNECGEDYKEIYIKILLQQVQRFDPTPINHHQAMHTRRGTGNLGRRRKLSQGFSSDLTGITKPLSNKGKEKVINVEEERKMENLEQAPVLSIDKRREERQRSMSLI